MEEGELRDRTEEMPKRARKKTTRRKTISRLRKRPYRKKYSYKSAQRRKKKPKKTLWDLIFG